VPPAHAHSELRSIALDFMGARLFSRDQRKGVHIRLDDNSPRPEFVAMHPKLIRSPNGLVVQSVDGRLKFLDWLAELDLEVQSPPPPEALTF
jgi:hypothetical protein